ncbi:predicted protein [Chaetomium globosum CBS 148.51]|uniref:Uncharacterized protein n=1 Tax=Chaetomium globosum (strain ATCC 6205 / CBS 148.51 / DSM 1962 / NBRC 6347 / NRRL 1970) TaxID=306901 RepID=Q2H7P8_CHAGB|nr:uncharacterized protein CHGG_05317 [Chaetomium globosum CBS 148.51]EAQ88698.1 predicted protein [Chaetomium globosum CBS 148.51]
MNNGFSGKVRINKMGQSGSTRRLFDNREKQGMSGSGHDVLYETWCRNADLIFQNASTTALAQGCAGHRRPGDGSAGDTPSQPPPAHSGCGGGGNSAALSRAEATKGQENERENTNLLVQRGIQIVIIVSQVLSHFVQRSARVMQGKDRRPIGIGPKEHPIGDAVRESATVVVFGSTARGSKRKRRTRK